LKTFAKALLSAQKLYECHGYAIRSAPRTFITEVLFIDWLETIFLPRISELRRNFDYDGPSILIVDGHSTHVTPRVIVLCGAWNVIMIRLVDGADPSLSLLICDGWTAFEMNFVGCQAVSGLEQSNKAGRELKHGYFVPIILILQYEGMYCDFPEI
jgi:hypothetical protein